MAIENTRYEQMGSSYTKASPAYRAVTETVSDPKRQLRDLFGFLASVVTRWSPCAAGIICCFYGLWLLAFGTPDKYSFMHITSFLYFAFGMLFLFCFCVLDYLSLFTSDLSNTIEFCFTELQASYTVQNKILEWMKNTGELQNE